jgi:hypothetical protein
VETGADVCEAFVPENSVVLVVRGKPIALCCAFEEGSCTFVHILYRFKHVELGVLFTLAVTTSVGSTLSTSALHSFNVAQFIVVVRAASAACVADLYRETERERRGEAVV